MNSQNENYNEASACLIKQIESLNLKVDEAHKNIEENLNDLTVCYLQKTHKCWQDKIEQSKPMIHKEEVAPPIVVQHPKFGPIDLGKE
jgi:hypothetical protein